ncbi:MmgE/PrpD family protein [Paracoccus pantotrophus]|uniref:MmgE/PrpD family protein n=1 Tax=Paracoccus pantotrophus TaxID=82367 RepID=UPI0004907513|nr:MmgE/PrpD family protein [Paracoccus pantotrophus]
MTSLEELTDALVDFATAPPNLPVPPFYRLVLMNWLGCALAGAATSAVDRAVAVHAADAGGTWLPPIGRRERLGLSATVLIDCLSSAVLAYDDIHFETTLHPTGPVAAAIFGLARSRAISGARALEALRLGMEVECRFSRLMMGPDTGSAPGWYPTGIAGGLGAAAATAWLLGFGRDRMRHALGLAATRAAGMRGTHGGMSAFYVPAVSAEAGYVAARLAEAGFTSGPGALSGPMGLLRQIAPTPAVSAAGAGLGQVFQSEATACKPYPYGFISFALIDCCTALSPRVTGPDDIAKVEAEVSTAAARLGNNPDPRSMFEAQISLRFIAALVLTAPAAAHRPLREDFHVGPAEAALMPRIEIRAATDLADHQARVVLTTRSGERIAAHCDTAPGSAARLPGASALQAKFLDLATPVVGATVAGQCLQDLMAVGECDDVATLLDRIAPA